MNYRNYPLLTAIALYFIILLVVTLTPEPKTPAWAKLVAPFLGLGALVYGAAYVASCALEAITVRLAGSIGASLMVLDQKAHSIDTTAEVCVELDDANQTLELRPKLRMPSALPMLDTTRKDWHV